MQFYNWFRLHQTLDLECARVSYLKNWIHNGYILHGSQSENIFYISGQTGLQLIQVFNHCSVKIKVHTCNFPAITHHVLATDRNGIAFKYREMPLNVQRLCSKMQPRYKPVPYFEACFQKKSVSISFLTKTNFLENFSRNAKSSSTCTKISYRSWCKSFNVLSVQWYIKFYDVFFVFFCYFAAARSNAIHLLNACNML